MRVVPVNRGFCLYFSFFSFLFFAFFLFFDVRSSLYSTNIFLHSISVVYLNVSVIDYVSVYVPGTTQINALKSLSMYDGPKAHFSFPHYFTSLNSKF